MPRKVIVCIDGTGNEIGDRETNVLKVYKALDKGGKDQCAHYIMGVGTYDGPQFLGRARQVISGGFGQAFGYGLEDDVLSAYRFLCHRYQSREAKRRADPGLSEDAAENDQIYIMGFSRGAYAARVLAGFIHNFGLVDPERLHLISPVFRAYRRVTDFNSSANDAKVFQALREYERVLEPDHPPIRALLLFDTVSSMIRFRRPLANLFRTGSLVEFGTHASVNANVSVRIVLHALAIDERRALFRAQRWQPERDPESGEALYFGNNFRNPKTRRRQYVTQRWFPGFHSDVGGSPAENESGIGKIALLWMLDALEEVERQADAEDDGAQRVPLPAGRRHGLRLKQGARKRYLEGGVDSARTPGGLPFAKPDPAAPRHNSYRAGLFLSLLWLAMEFFPKSLQRREAGRPSWPRRGWLLFWYLPLFEPRRIPAEDEIDPSAGPAGR